MHQIDVAAARGGTRGGPGDMAAAAGRTGGWWKRFRQHSECHAHCVARSSVSGISARQGQALQMVPQAALQTVKQH